MLAWNAQKVKKLTSNEIWLFIIGRVLVAFGMGIVAMKYFPMLVEFLDIPVILIGALCLVIAARGLKRRP